MEKSTKIAFTCIIILIIGLSIQLNVKVNNLQLIEERNIVMTNNFSEIVEKIKPAVVRIITETNDNSLPYTGEYIILDNKIVLSGTGFLVSEDGYILTAEHVVRGTNSSIVLLQQKNELIKANAKVIDRNINADVALLKIEGENLPFLELAENEELKEGMDVGFIGFPLSFGFPITHKGVLSGKGLYRYASSTKDVKIYTINAFVNSGNSGGPLFSATDGKVIGIINARVNQLDQNKLVKIPDDYSGGITIGGVDPIRLPIDLYNDILRYVGEISQVGIGFSSSIEYGKEIINKNKE